VGIGRVWPAYVQGTIPARYADEGVVAGWNVIEPSFDGSDAFTVRDPKAIPLAADLWPVETATLGGTWDLVTDPSIARVALVPFQFLAGGTVTSILVDEIAADPWEVTVSGAPPADHVFPGASKKLPSEWAFEFLLAYIDVDGSEDPSLAGDTILGSACVDDMIGTLLYLAPTDDLEDAFGLSVMGLQTGWWAAGIDPGSKDGPAPLTSEQAAALSFSDACGLGG
jgi:hypothetical protein